jgi:hypothetical protein
MGIREKWLRTKELSSDKINEKLEKLNKIFNNKALLVYRFGRLNGDDIDLAILPKPKIDFYQLRCSLWEYFKTQRVDLVNLEYADTVLRFHIIKTGKLIYKENTIIENRFELAVIRTYKDTAYLRKKQNQIYKRKLHVLR